MGKGKKKEKKTGKKKSKLGKQVSKDAADRKDHVKTVQWRNKVKQPAVLLATGQGDAYQYGEMRESLRVLLKLVDEAKDLTWNSEAGCTSIVAPQAGHSGPDKEFPISAAEPEAWVAHRAGTWKAPTTGAEGTVYERQKKHGSGGPSSVDLRRPGHGNNFLAQGTQSRGTRLQSWEALSREWLENHLNTPLLPEVPAYWACLGCGQQRAWTLRGQTEILKQQRVFGGSGVAGKGKAHASALKNLMLGVAGRPRRDKLMYGF